MNLPSTHMPAESTPQQKDLADAIYSRWYVHGNRTIRCGPRHKITLPPQGGTYLQSTIELAEHIVEIHNKWLDAVFTLEVERRDILDRFAEAEGKTREEMADELMERAVNAVSQHNEGA